MIWILNKTLTAFLDAVEYQLPGEARFISQRIRVPDFYKYVTRSTKDSPGEYRWRCPDPNYDWHYAVQDQGFCESSIDARIELMQHWGLHHSEWNPYKEDHEEYESCR